MTVALGGPWGIAAYEAYEAAAVGGPSLPWPATVNERLVWLTLILVWTLASYYAGSDPPLRAAVDDPRDDAKGSHDLVALRSGIVAVATFLLLGRGPAPMTVAVVLAGTTWVLAHGRAYLAERRSRWLAEWEIGLNLVVIAGLGVVTAAAGFRPTAIWVRIDAPAHRIAVVAGVLTTVALMGRPATYVVRGILSRVDILPRVSTWPVRAALPTEPALDASRRVDVREYNRGLVIGNLERLVVLALVALGQFAALGFLIAAKGLIRSREFENRNFAEYFLVGTLSSVVVALAAGLAVHAMVYAWW
jgi:hypothetical protein